MSQGCLGFVHQVHAVMHTLKPLHAKKSPGLAFVLGFLFGPIGIGIYFRRFSDFLFCTLLLISLGVIIPGLGLVPGWLFSGFYGFYRAETSNERLPPDGSTSLH